MVEIEIRWSCSITLFPCMDADLGISRREAWWPLCLEHMFRHSEQLLVKCVRWGDVQVVDVA